MLCLNYKDTGRIKKHCLLIAWGISAEARVAPDIHQSPHSTLHLFTHRMMCGEGGLGESPW